MHLERHNPALAVRRDRVPEFVSTAADTSGYRPLIRQVQPSRPAGCGSPHWPNSLHYGRRRFVVWAVEL